MEEEIELIIDSTREAMDNAIKHLEKQLINIRAGKASPSMVSGVKVDYYGTPTPLNQVANVNTPDGMTISIQPWEKSLIPEIERGIQVANLGFNPMNNGESVIINVPPLTEERRKELVKQAKAEAEEAKIGVRNDRKTANQDIKNLDASDDMKKNLEIDIQEMTDKHISKIDAILEAKEKEIMKV
ncbi:MAG: ribosome recycling factor [Flavobacteriaceae bacterium]|uniref:ribosome recycling factor n=1 Tax=Leeuwenhoekiella sp. UBA1003 TaxID=1946744 RepID=UPI000C93C950|nr:ribosome recycling factor [Leeuwenhoekiella sp. UBA1003]MAT90085.1 ribosome recycling factor [Flavobacteriaceae bacterium]|tara:strand:+ start:9549 stop:10103 length:555 start_codon:yes stop_codon:yes gene_type:complete